MVLGSVGTACLLISNMGAADIALVVAVLNKFPGLNLLSRMAEQAVFVMMPPLILVFLVPGTIFIGLATPTGPRKYWG